MSNRLLLFIACLLSLNLFSSQKVVASHAMGADLTYLCLGGDQYTITISFYRDCAGISAPPSMTVDISSSCGPAMSVTLDQISFQEVSLLCPTAISTCNGGGQPGVEQYIYTDTVTMLPCSDWLIEWEHCCRNAGIDNLVNPDSELMHVRATLDNTLGCNSSPIFTNLPVPYTCNSEEYNYNHGAIDIDGDSIVYTLVQPLGSGGATIPYIPGYSAIYPIFTSNGSVAFNNATGQMDFTPIGNQICVVTVLVEEYRNGVLIGTTMRDIQVVDVLTCSNFSPDLQAPGIFNEQNAVLIDTLNVQVCVGANMSYQFTVADPDVPDTITVTTNMAIAIPGASFTQTGINPVTVTVSWTPTQADLGMNIYTITFRDNGCPVIGQSIVAFTIEVLDGTYAGEDVFLCDGDTAQLGVGGGTQFQWTPATFLSNDTIADPMSWPTTTTSYVVTSDYVGQCSNTDTITVNVVTPFTMSTAADVILCSSGSAQLLATPSPPGIYDYLWTPSSDLDFDDIPNPLASPTSSTLYQVAVTSQSGCTRYENQLVTVAPTPLITAPTIDEEFLCQGMQTMVNANVDAGDCNAYVASQVPYGLVPGSGTVVSLADDALSPALPIGFSFNFYCTAYTNFYISSNGFVTFSFNSGNNGCCSGQVLPNAANPNNLIAFAWEDLSPQTGNVDYFTTGTAPTRILVINFMNVPHYNSANMVNTQILLYEGTNQIEIHTQSMTTDGGSHTMGIENSSGAMAVPVPGRNSTSWSANNECWRFTPLTPPPYTVVWFDSDSNIVGTTDNAAVMPDSSTTYTVLITDGNCSSTQTVDVNVSFAYAGPDTAMCLGDTVPLSAFYVGTTGIIAPTSCGPSAGCGGGSGVPNTVGTGTGTGGSSTYPAPYGNFYKNAKHQMLYTAADLTAAGVAPGTITDIGWYVNSIVGTNLYKSFTISMGCTNITSLSTWQTGLTQVFTPKNYTIGVGLNNHVLDTQYDWDGTSNLIVEICFNNLSDPSWTNNSISPFTVTGYTSVIWYRSDAAVACPFTGAPTGTSFNRPNTRFTVCTDSVVTTYSWSPGGELSDSTIANPLASPSVPTNYIVTVDNGVCQVTDTVFVDPSSLVLNDSITSESCSGMCDGQAQVTAIGITPYTYAWSDVDTQSTALATGLCSGTYTVSVTDGGGCTVTLTDTVPNGGILTTTVQNVIYASCNGICDGAATMVVAGGVAPYTFLWSDGMAQTTLTATGLCAGTYIFTMVDSLGCFTSDSAVIDEPSSLTTSTNVTCMGACDGIAVVTPVGGLAPYTYLWSDGLGQTTSAATNLCSGIYFSNVTDANGCVVLDTVQVNAPSTIITGTVCPDTSCNGVVTITPVGSTGPYTYLWDDLMAQTDSTAVNLCPGTYTVQAWDGNGCTMFDTINIAQPLVTAITDSIMVTCSDTCDGSGTVTAVTGQAPFAYLWSDAGNQTGSTAINLCVGTYSVLIMDGNSCLDSSTVTITGPTALILQTAATCFNVCDGSANVSTTGGTAPYVYAWDDVNAQTDSVATGLCAGFYTVSVTDANGCVITDTTTIFAPSTQITSAPATCQGKCDGASTIAVLGGQAPYNYLWDDPLAQTGITATDLCVGWSRVAVIDASGCLVVDSVYVGEASPVQLVVNTVTDISCFGVCDGEIVYLDPTEGTTPFTYQWFDINKVPLGVTIPTASNLCAGAYYLEVEDAVGCTDADTITLVEPTSMTINTNVLSNVSCAGECDGAGEANAAGGTQPYNYLWNDPLGQTGSTAIGLCGGTWSVTITDNESCELIEVVIINEPTKLLASTGNTMVNCEYDCDGSITTTATGGWSPYTYAWTGASSQTNATATGLCVGAYLVKVTDLENCVVQVVDTIKAVSAPPLVANFGGMPMVTTIFNSTIVFTNLSTGAQTYKWTFGDGSTETSEQHPEHEFPNAEPGVYDVWLITTNALGCQDSILREVVIKGDFSLFAPSAFTPNDDGINDEFFPKGIGVDKNNFVMYIFDRWGDIIYETDDIDKPWDGHANDGRKVSRIETYVWKIETYDLDGVEHEYVGSVTLVQ